MINDKTYVSAVITAGGNGTRFSKTHKKQFSQLGHKSILEWTILAFYTHSSINEIILSVPEEDLEYCCDLFKKYDDKLKIVVGGKTRQESVFIGLNHCHASTDLVFIHDGVRPFVKPNEISDLLLLLSKNDAVIPVTPIKNTIKIVNEHYVEKTLNRDVCFEVHTPQVFRYNLISECHKKALEINKTFTDDAGICEYFNIPVFTYVISNYNIKITNPDDSIVANAILKEFIKEVDYD